MAKIKLNSLLADVRGRLGSVVFSSNAAGFHCRVLKAPSGSVSVLQNNQRTRFSRLVSSWNLLTPAERALWTTYAAQVDNVRYDWFGDPYYPNARAQFFSVNTARLLNGDTITATAPTGSVPAPLPAMGGGVDPSGVSFTSYVSNLAAFDASIMYVHIAISVTNSPGRSTPILPFRFVLIQPTASGWPVEIDAELSAIYGNIAQSGSWWFSLTPLSSEFRPGTVSLVSDEIGQEVT